MEKTSFKTCYQSPTFTPKFKTMEEKTEITLTAGYHRVNSREVMVPSQPPCGTSHVCMSLWIACVELLDIPCALAAPSEMLPCFCGTAARKEANATRARAAHSNHTQ